MELGVGRKQELEQLIAAFAAELHRANPNPARVGVQVSRRSPRLPSSRIFLNPIQSLDTFAIALPASRSCELYARAETNRDHRFKCEQ